MAAFPRAEFPVSGYNRGAVWSKFYLQLPGSGKPNRINVHRYWRNELDQLAAAFPASPGVTVSAIPVLSPAIDDAGEAAAS